MIKIELKNASNGVIKTVIDTRDNKETTDTIKVYEIDSTSKLDSFIAIVDLVDDIIQDLGLDAGSDHEPLQIQHDIDWGEKYNPSIEEVEQKIKTLNAQVKELKEYKRVLIENANNV
jgi:hypothetical protein